MAWFQRKYTKEEVRSLVDAIKDFNVGARDLHFSRAVDLVALTWTQQKTGLFKRSFTKEEVEELLRRIDLFKAGAIDGALSRHIKQVYEAWLQRMK
jgi:hypothetical protein